MILSSINLVKTNTHSKSQTHKHGKDGIRETVRDAVKEAKCQELVPSRLQPEISNDVTVSMETRDGYLLGFHNMHNKVVLLDLETPNKNCILRQRTLSKSHHENQVLVAFHLNHDRTKYVAVGADRRVEISVNSSDPDPSSPDERVFVLHEVDDNILFIQPYHHKGYYFHHIDEQLEVRKFELNNRPPEEFFFRLNTVIDIQNGADITAKDKIHSSAHVKKVNDLNGSSGSTERSVFQFPVNSEKWRNSQKRKSKSFQKLGLFKQCLGLMSKSEKCQENKENKYV